MHLVSLAGSSRPDLTETTLTHASGGSGHPEASQQAGRTGMSQIYTRCPEPSPDGPSSNRLCSNGLCSRGLCSHRLLNDRVLTDCVPTDSVLTDCVLSNGLCSHGLYSNGLCSNGLYSHGLSSNGLYSHGLCSNGLCSTVRSMGQCVVQVQGFRQRSSRAWGRQTFAPLHPSQ